MKKKIATKKLVNPTKPVERHGPAPGKGKGVGTHDRSRKTYRELVQEMEKKSRQKRGIWVLRDLFSTSTL